MSSFVFVRRSRGFAVVAATCASVVFAGSAFADVKICQSLDQRFEQIERGATTLEVNAMLFSAADKGCEPLAKKLLDAGASLEARDRLGFNPLARAAKSGQDEIVALFLDRGAPIDARSLDGSTALYRGRRDRAAADRAAIGRARRGCQPCRAQRHHAAFSRRLYGQRADRRAVDREGRRSEGRRHHR